MLWRLLTTMYRDAKSSNTGIVYASIFLADEKYI